MSNEEISETWRDFVDDASPLPDRPPVTRLDHAYVGTRVALDRDLPLLTTCPGPLRVVLSGGAAQLGGRLRRAGAAGVPLAVLETSLRDPADPAGNARRVVAALDAARAYGLLGPLGPLERETEVQVRVAGEPSPGWLAALDELAAAELALVLPVGPSFAGWADAALDRELIFSLYGGDVDAATGALRITARLWDGDAAALGVGRRWCRSWSTSDPLAAIARLEQTDELDG